MPQTRAAKKRSEAKLQLQQDTLGLGQQRGPSSDDVYIYDGGSKSAFKWEDVHKEFESSAHQLSCVSTLRARVRVRCDMTQHYLR